MLFVGMLLLTVGYTMIYAALHGNWQFWTYFFPKRVQTQSTTTPATGTVAA